jgi:Divergent InlB B-repeat domain
MISVGLIFSMLGVVAPPASARASGRISARLATNAFTVAQAGKVRLSYKFSSKSARFRYVLSREQGANWLQVRSTSKRGSFRGSHRMTVRQLFGSKAVKVGQYRVKLSADANSVTLRFRLKQASPAPAPAPVPKPVPAPPAVSSNVVVVTTTADDVNGDVSSVPALNANPGNDGISLREALGAADATGGSATVYVLFSAALNGQTIEVMSELPPIHRDHLVLEGVAPDGSPARVTLDARLAAPATLGELLLVQASHVTVRWLRLTGVNPTGNPTGREAAVVVRQGPNIGVAPSPGPPHIADIQIVDDVFDNRGVNLPPRTQTGPLSDGLLVGTILGAGANTGVSGLTVARNTFANYNDDAVGVWEDSQGTTANGVVIQDNTFDQNEYAIELAEGGNGPSQAGARIIGNTITRGGIGITLNGNATNGTFDDTLIEGNAISGAEGTAINLDAAAFAPGLGSTGSDVISNTQIVNNVIRANSASAFSGIRLAGGNVTSSPPSRISAVTIENNSLVNDGPGSLFVSNPNDAPGVNGNQITDVIVRNSILYDPSGTPILEGAGPVVNQPPDVVMNSLISGPGWAGTNGNITGDPLLVDEPHGDYHLAAGSPAIDAGTTIDAPSDDLDGALRNAQPDIGAFEFGALPRPMLTVTAEELGGSGAVSSSPAAINCGTACGARFDRNTTVTLTATPGSDSAFSGWSGGGCSGTGSCTVMMSSDQTVTATFVPTTHTLTVSRLGGGSGSVAGTGISCPGTCSASYASGTMVTLIATPASGSAFSGWSGGGCNGTGSCTVTMSSDQTVAATFTVPDPSISAFKLTNSRFTVGPHATAIKARASTAAKPRKPKVPQGSAFVYTLSRASTATIVIERRRRGRVVGKKCVARTKANAKKKSCTITTRVGRLTRKSKTGRNTIAFSGRIRRKALAPASYRATITARAGTGPTSKPRSATFTIVHG